MNIFEMEGMENKGNLAFQAPAAFSLSMLIVYLPTPGLSNPDRLFGAGNLRHPVAAHPNRLPAALPQFISSISFSFRCISFSSSARTPWSPVWIASSSRRFSEYRCCCKLLSVLGRLSAANSPYIPTKIKPPLGAKPPGSLQTCPAACQPF